MTSFAPGAFVRITQGHHEGQTGTLIATAFATTEFWWVQLSAVGQRVRIAEVDMRPERRTSEIKVLHAHPAARGEGAG